MQLGPPMIPWYSVLLLSAPALAQIDQTVGVPPHQLASYVAPSSGKWKCLDGSKEIPWTSVNDDYCDCPDGSDEPGTSACSNGRFYCKNEGHIGDYIPSSRVNDGLCESQCCDGSDERPGVCPNACKEIGEEYRTKRDAERKLRKTGSKIRSSYITYAHKEKKRLEALVQTLQKEVQEQEQEVARLKDIAERTESISVAAMEHKKQSPLYQSLIKHSNAIKSLQREQKKLNERTKALEEILNALRSGYNPNYQDMAVLEAVRGWEIHAGLPHIGVEEDALNEEGTESESDEKAVDKVSSEPEEEQLEPGMWTAAELDKDLDKMLRTDYPSLLISHEEHVQSPSVDSILFDFESYLPDSLYPYYEEFKDTLVNWLETFGIMKADDGAASSDTSKAQQVFKDAEKNLKRIKDDLQKAEKDVTEIFSPNKFGAEGEWKKLDNSCIDLNTGDYTYEVCWFKEAKQKPNNGGSTFSLGKFSSWNPADGVEVGTPEYHSKQIYDKGARCWNGPERSVILVLTCGTENALLSVNELQKCEYQFEATTPALCLPLSPAADSRDEL